VSARSREAPLPSPPGLLGATAAILRKDLRLALRGREAVPPMALFAVTVFALFHFGSGRSSLEPDLAAGVLWVTLLLASVLAVVRLFAPDREQGAIEAILLAPIDRTAIFAAKAAALLLYLVAVELVALPAFALLLLGPDPQIAVAPLLAVLALADLGIACVGALVAAIAIETRAREVVVPLLLLPLLVPVCIAAAGATRPLLAGAGSLAQAAPWLGFLGLYAIVFLLLSVAVFDFLLED
jgi:heme exporter protein B